MHSPNAYVSGCLVEYCGATERRGSIWRATITRGTGAANRYRVSVPFADGPDAAAAAVVARFNECTGSVWRVLGAALSLDGGNRYAYATAPIYYADTIRSALRTSELAA